MSAINETIYGSTDAGYVPRQLADIQRAINESLVLIEDPNTGEHPFQNAGDDTILQQVVAIVAEAMSHTENAAGWLARMRDPLTAVGALLSALVQLNGMIRKPGAPTIVMMELTGAPSTLIVAGSLIGVPNTNITFATNQDVVIPASGMVNVPALNTVKGEYNPGDGTVVAVQTPVSGWSGATNITTLAIGTEEETDVQLRRRQQLSTALTSYRQIEAIRAAIINVAGVTFCRAYQNSSLVTDERGIPGKCLACVVVGGDEVEVAEAILFRVPLGIGYYGNVSQIFYDDQDIPTVVQFSRPVDRLISVQVILERIIDERVELFPDDGEELVKDAILEFAENGSNNCEPYGNPGFPPGQDIVRTQLYTPINSIGGTRVVAVRLGIDGQQPVESDIVIAWDEIGTFTRDRIEVTVL